MLALRKTGDMLTNNKNICRLQIEVSLHSNTGLNAYVFFKWNIFSQNGQKMKTCNVSLRNALILG